MKIEHIIEAVLFAAGEPVAADKLASITNLDKEGVISAVQSLADEYDEQKRGVKIIRLEDKFQMVSRDDYAGFVQQLVQAKVKRTLAPSIVETMAIIAYKQPCTKQVIEELRGVNSDFAVNRLLQMELIEEKGRLDSPGRPILFGTTDAFLRYLGITSVDELPNIGERI